MIPTCELSDFEHLLKEFYGFKTMTFQKKWFVTGIGTNVGKTIVSAILTEALQADYWKPIQSGDLHDSDSHKIQQFITNSKTKIHEESYKLQTPASPHLSAALDNIELDINAIQLPPTDNHLIVEGAGGVLVPLSERHLLIDLIAKLELEVVLVSQHYLGSINHTLLSVEALQRRNIPIAGIIFNGERTTSSEQIILHYTNVPCLGYIPRSNDINRDWVAQQAQNFRL